MSFVLNRFNAVRTFMERGIIQHDEGNINSDVFYEWVTKELVFSLPENSVIVLDNATFNKRSDSIEAIQNEGHTILFLPPYSPDLNPIEKKWVHQKKAQM